MRTNLSGEEVQNAPARPCDWSQARMFAAANAARACDIGPERRIPVAPSDVIKTKIISQKII